MRKFLFLLFIAISMSLTASSKDSQQAVSMVSYEQSWLDSEGTLALKNNTDEYIHNVSYRIMYLDMSGNVLDYKDYTSEVEIAPGLAKKVDIPAYEHGRSYSYYKSESSVSRPHKFKIKFQLNGYNLPEEEVQQSEYNGLPSGGYDSSFYNMMEESHSAIFGSGSMQIIMIFVLLLMLGAGIGLLVLVAFMAKKRNRNAALWILISILSTPVLAIILLLCLGQADD